MGRILAIDYGRRRTGLAVTDPAQIIPGGLTTVATGELLKFLDDYMKRETVERVVVGWPTQTSGQPSENQQRVAEFVRAFERRHPDVPVVKVDVDENMALAAAFQIESIPTLLVFRDGQPVHKSVGFISRAEIEQLIN